MKNLSAQLGNRIVDLEQELEKKLNDVKSFNNAHSSIQEMFTIFKEKDHKSNKEYENYKTPTTKLD